MNKKVKEVFFSLANEDNKFCEANVCEVKFSKKLNAVIVSASSEDNISLFNTLQDKNELYILQTIVYRYVSITFQFS